MQKVSKEKHGTLRKPAELKTTLNNYNKVWNRIETWLKTFAQHCETWQARLGFRDETYQLHMKKKHMKSSIHVIDSEHDLTHWLKH